MKASATPVRPRARNASATRSLLLRAAMRRFTVLGFERTTTRDIAADAGVNVSLIARYFGSKEGLFAAVLEQSADALEGAERSVEGDLVEGLLEGLRADAWSEFGGEHPLLLLLRDDSEGEAVKRLRQRAVDSAVAVLAHMITADGSDAATAETVLAVLVGVLTIRSARPHGSLASTDEPHLRELLQQLLGSIGAIDSSTAQRRGG